MGHCCKTLPLEDTAPLDVGWWGDASTSFGIGVVISASRGIWKWSSPDLEGLNTDVSIDWAEAAAVLMGLCMLLHERVLRNHPPSRRTILVHSDNAAVVWVINRGRARNQHLNAILQTIYMRLAETGLWLVAEHTPGVGNIADPLLRGQVESFLSQFPSAGAQTTTPIPDALQAFLVAW